MYVYSNSANTSLRKLPTNTNLKEVMLCKSCSSKGSWVAGVGGTASCTDGLQLQQPKCGGSGWFGHSSRSPSSRVVLHIGLSEEKLELVWAERCQEADQC